MKSCIIDHSVAPKQQTVYGLNVDTKQDDVFCILFTSGSTGTSKGVVLSHGNFINCLTWYWQEVPYSKNDIPCSKTNFLFIDYMLETFPAIFKCVPCVIMQQQHYQNLTSFVSYLSEYKVTRLFVVPSLLKLLASTENGDELCLTHVVCSGEALHTEIGLMFTEKFPNTDLYNYYGTTELQVVLVAKFTKENMSQNNNSIIGFPIYNTDVYIVKDDGSVVKDLNDAGELWVSGANISLGYINNETKTKEVYINNPFNDNGIFSKVYRTGDYVQLTSNGIEYIGRRDNFVKIRGHKVNLSDLETEIKNLFPGIQVCVLSKFSVNKCQERLYSFITECLLSYDEVFRTISENIEKNKIPEVVLLKRFPLTPTSGKIDRQVLLRSVDTTSNENEAKEPIYEELTVIQKIMKAVSKVLQLPMSSINPIKSFFDHGGDSITVFAFINELNANGMHTNLDCILRASSLADLEKQSTHSEEEGMTGVRVVPFSELCDSEVQFMAKRCSLIFETEEPLLSFLVKKFGITTESEFITLFTDCKENRPQYGLAIQIDGKSVGATINAPYGIACEDSVPHFIEAILMYCEDDIAQNLIDQGYNLMDSIVIYADSTLTSEMRTKVLHGLTQGIFYLTKRQGHTACISVDTNPATYAIDTIEFGYISEKVVTPKEFCVDGEYPFAEMDESYKLHTCVKYFEK